MEKDSKIILGISFLFTTIICVFSLLGKLTIIFSSNNLLEGLYVFCNRSSLWIVIVLGIIAVLYRLNHKQSQDVFTMLRDTTIRKTSSVLVIIDGLINLSGFLPVILSIKSSLEILKGNSSNNIGNLNKIIVIDFISLAIVICQILFGIYLLKYYESKKNNI